MILIAGAGIAGLTLGLTLHQIGVPFRIYEAVRDIRPLGVGINIQPNAVRELYDLGLEADLAAIGVATEEYGFYTKTGRPIWIEPRGRAAGYAWPQYSVHRGRLQMMLHDALIARAGAECIVTGARATGFAPEGRLLFDGDAVEGSLVIAADGIHSAIRAQMVPEEGAPHWGGAILWRGTTRATPFRGGAAMALCGHATQRVVAYPISGVGADGLQTINWIAELTVDPSSGWRREDWNRAADLEDFLPAFEEWDFGWLDVPGLIRGAEAVYEYPMVDRDPIDRWTHGAVTLMGDAAHPTYPVGSNGATTAIIDARKIGAVIRAHGVTPDALHAYEAEMRPRTAAVTLANRGSGPDAVMQMVEDACGGVFDRIEDVIDPQILADHAAKYKALAGYGIAEINAAPPILPR
ncbi:2-polyprenyl-6-methoxyphenol hydroxylase-like FAD-dependent oxidoreductase [Rubricella aquisinus]|uniref:2-polyprenyl-6-methoxyphenol hydroxylase-like FAD-dependent oxidoreductase n=1 Tax=Rubricella aquisinus TaxID=2028108 RepID=A0A840WI88_9RHOB|nr:flavin-dependent oxidoreductase [Rubricella aquisinus]MBB5514201.1 2-polyprenyl-6-methoxyphenol hydroxylase-like FAD-dependent oxidoreductase [Rubricella aquisinus]